MSIPAIALNSGTSIPQLGLGVWQASDEETERAVGAALDAGYRHIDTAAAYGNEAAVGRGLAASSVPREDVFVTTKLWNADHGHDQALAAVDASLQRLGVDYVDLYLIHWPLQDRDRLLRTWDAMEEIAESGRAKAVGVCNFEPHHLQLLVDRGGMLPAVDQVELNPHLTQKDIRAEAAKLGIAVESWSPLGGTSRSGWGPESKPNTLLGDDTIGAIAQEHGVTPAQVLIRWHLDNGLIVIPKSVHPERIAQNFDVFGFALTADDMTRIAALDDGTRLGLHPDEMNLGAP
ncbi:aldo/keto reductase [Tomitella fengzijianii]|uniref:Aldo/keto reductase n=1 Tax=Tomitella fengzijianii TaxID=2597660 RepID=A0A516X5X9_9ACTN|nr:aldo/keto reductase [Tomitella fengzijianii]QDQ98477.1 aldo/keto reductase [Tomitella fengzijianii]